MNMRMLQPSQCPKFAQQPQFVKMGLVHGEKWKSTKKQKFSQRLFLVEVLQERGNRFYQLQFYQLACYEYEKALTVFAYIDCKKMKINEIRDEDLIYRNYDYLHPQEKSKLEEISLHIYLNLSICYMKLEMFKDSIYACDYALKIDPKSIKAFYRRAQARLMSNDSTESDYVQALNDLKSAGFHNSQNESIQKEWNKIENELKEMRKKKEILISQHFNNQQQDYQQFNDEEYEEDDDEEEDEDDIDINQEYDKFHYELSFEQDPTKQIPREVKELGKFLDVRGKQMVEMYRQNKKEKEAQELEEKLDRALKAKIQLEKISQLDFNRPKKELKDIAGRYGIDLYDKEIQNEFKKIQEQNIQDIRDCLKQNEWEWLMEEQKEQLEQQPQQQQTIQLMQNKKKPRLKNVVKSKSWAKPKRLSKESLLRERIISEQFSQGNNLVQQQQENQQKVQSKSAQQQQDQEEVDLSVSQDCCACLISNCVLVIAIALIVYAIYSFL